MQNVAQNQMLAHSLPAPALLVYLTADGATGFQWDIRGVLCGIGESDPDVEYSALIETSCSTGCCSTGWCRSVIILAVVHPGHKHR